MTLVSSWLTSPQNSKRNIGSGHAEFLRKGAREKRYNDGVIGSRIRSFDCYQNYRPWISFNGRYAKQYTGSAKKVSLLIFAITLSTARQLS